MSLYDSIAASYDLVFPLRPPKLAFATSLARAAGRRVLDIGCATGALALELAREGFDVVGVDLDAEMVAIAARRAAGLSATFETLDMARVGERYAARSFDAVLCLGNTVVHLPDAASIGAFLRAVRGLLARDGRFAVQLVNYDRVLDGAVERLPTIENAEVRFTRSYRLEGEPPRVRFATELTVKATGAVHRDETLLTPMRPAELIELAAAAGLSPAGLYADFAGRPFSAQDESLLAVLAPAAS